MKMRQNGDHNAQLQLMQAVGINGSALREQREKIAHLKTDKIQPNGQVLAMTGKRT